MAVFSITGQQNTLGAGYKTAIECICAASNPRRQKVFDINVSQSGAPASTDTNIQFDVSTLTGTGTGTAGNPIAVDPGDTFVDATGKNNDTIEGTVTASTSKFNIGLNQRAPYRWQTYLGSGAELVYAATASNGWALRALSAGYTGAAGGTVFFQEQ